MSKTTLFLDCEFDGFGGELISIALVNDLSEMFYVVVKETAKTPWVQDNVIPILFNHPRKNGMKCSLYEPDGFRGFSLEEASIGLQEFLNIWEEVTIIADWPEDFVHLFKLMLTGPGMRIKLPKVNTVLALDCHTGNSKIPHNALADAEALCEDYRKKHGS